MLKSLPPTKESKLFNKVNYTLSLDPNNTSINNQHRIIYSALVIKPQSTIDLRHVYGIMQPAPRIKELRDMGYQIDTVRVNESTPDNIKHNAVAKYVLTQKQPITSNQESKVTL